MILVIALFQAEQGKNSIAKKVDGIELFSCWNGSTCFGASARKEEEGVLPRLLFSLQTLASENAFLNLKSRGDLTVSRTHN